MIRTLTWLVFSLLTAVLVFLGTFISANVRIVIGSAAGFVSIILMIISRHQLGRSFSVMPQAKTLVTSGIYSKIRHPIYLFLDMFLASVIFIMNIPYLLIPWAVIITMQAVQSNKEEKVLADAFGHEYETYRQRTWM